MHLFSFGYLLIGHAKQIASICNSLISDSSDLVHVRACKETMATHTFCKFFCDLGKKNLFVKHQNNSTILKLN